MICPDELPEFFELPAIERAVLLKVYMAELDREMARVKTVYTEACAKAHADGMTKTQEWKLTVKYATGISSKPDVSMLRASYPEQYKLLYDRQFLDFTPSMTKADLKWLFTDEERAVAEAKISVNHPVATQYVLMPRGDGE